MIAVPKRYFHNEGIKVISSDKNGLYIDCEVVAPKSMIGRSVTVYFDVKDGALHKMLLLCRDKSISVRQ